MFQGGELALQAGCEEFDSLGVHYMPAVISAIQQQWDSLIVGVVRLALF